MKIFKNIIIIVIILVILVLAYFLFFGKTSTPNNTTTSGLQSSNGSPVTGIVNPGAPTSIEASKISAEFVSQLLNLKAIKLNDNIFSSLAFQSLQDFTITLIQPGNEGRTNPFAPFGTGDSSSSASPSGTSGQSGSIQIFPTGNSSGGNTLQDFNGS